MLCCRLADSGQLLTQRPFATEKFSFDVSNSFSNLAYMTENFQNVVIVIVNICLTIYNIEIVAYWILILTPSVWVRHSGNIGLQLN